MIYKFIERASTGINYISLYYIKLNKNEKYIFRTIHNESSFLLEKNKNYDYNSIEVDETELENKQKQIFIRMIYVSSLKDGKY